MLDSQVFYFKAIEFKVQLSDIYLNGCIYTHLYILIYVICLIIIKKNTQGYVTNVKVFHKIMSLY